MIIQNVKCYTEEGVFKDREIHMAEGVFTDECIGEKEIIDGGGCFAIPGLIDLHFHGCKGYDVCDATIEAWEEIAKYEASIGVTTICPATMTLPLEELLTVLSVAAEFKKNQKEGADLVGLNMEGPFISRVKKGAQDERNILPCEVALCKKFLEVSEGLVKIIGLAPEENDDNFIEFIEALKDEVIISLAHTNADYAHAKAAFDAGAKHAVHLYNAMPAFSHRQPGVVGAVFDSPKVRAELICDGVHIHPSMVRATFQMLGEDRMILISDSMRAAGMPDGRYTLGGLDVDVRGKYATLVSDGALAGSATNLMDCMKTAVKEMGLPLETAVKCATENPAKCLGIYEKYGSISPGKRANLVLLDAKLNTKLVIKDGKIITPAK